MTAATILDSFNLTDKVALVTGGGRGLGRAICVGFAQAGADIVAVSRSAGPLAETEEQVRAQGRRCLTVECNVTVKAQIEAAVNKAVQEFGKIDILVNNAGGTSNAAGKSYDYPVVEMPEDVWDRQLELNLKAAFLCCQAVGKVMMEQGGGKIVNIGASNSFVARAGSNAPYNVAKAGLNNLTKHLAAEWGEMGIWVNCIAASGMHTPAFERARQSRLDRGLDPNWLTPSDPDRPPVKLCLAEPEEYVPIALFLASQASNHLTGDIISPGGVALLRS